MTIFAFAQLQVIAAYADGGAARPTVEEVRTVESQFRKPHGARSLKHYVRYYYAGVTPMGRVIRAIYIDKGWFSDREKPAEQVIIVDSESDIPDVEDGECSVLYVESEPGSHVAPSIGCSGGVVG